jgi:hypothetical protein
MPVVPFGSISTTTTTNQSQSDLNLARISHTATLLASRSRQVVDDVCFVDVFIRSLLRFEFGNIDCQQMSLQQHCHSLLQCDIEKRFQILSLEILFGDM